METIKQAIKETKKTLENIHYIDHNREGRILKNQLLILETQEKILDRIGKFE